MKQAGSRHCNRLESSHQWLEYRWLANHPKAMSRCLLPVLLVIFGQLYASPADLDQATRKYHAGYPAQAIDILKPLAMQGDMQAQNLIGNIVYGLAQSNPTDTTGDTTGDPLKWYLMAATQGSSEASYALGAIYHNRWLQNKREEDGRLAQYYYQQAFDRGYARAEAPLMQMAARNSANRQSSSLKYNNSSFSSKRATPHEPEIANVTSKQLTPDGFADLELTGDPIADAAKLEALLQKINELQGAIGLPDTGGSLPDENVLTQMLANFGVSQSQASRLVQMLEQFKAVSD
jgi:hypothetical protein